MQEIWKDIQGYENSYQVSNLGNVKSLGGKSNHKNEIILKQSIVMGYKVVSLTKNSKYKMYKVHRLIGIAFIDNPFNKPEINHIDGNKLNNSLNNLEWVTKSENKIHSIKIGTSIVLRGKDNSRSKPVKMLTINGIYIRTFGSIREAARQTGLSHSNINKCIQNRYKQVGGYKWII